MAKLEFFVVSDSIAIDQFSNRASIFNILEEIKPQKFPLSLYQATAMSLWLREEGDESTDFQVVLRVHLPDGTSHDFRSNFQFAGQRHRISNRLEGLPITCAGDLRFEIMLNGEHAAEHLVSVYGDRADAASD